MIFRNSNGDLIEINKYDYPNDQIYYEKVMKLQEEFTKCNFNKKNGDKKLIIKDLFHDNISNISSSNQLNKICTFINIK
jgi:hypothetical protein